MMCPVSSSSAELVVEEQEAVSVLPRMFMLAGVTTMGGDWCGWAGEHRSNPGAALRQTEERRLQPSLALPLCCAVPPAGTLLFLSLALFVFTRESHRCLPQLTQSHGVLMVTLKRLLSPGFLACLAQT